jgi:hypothetical protein
LTVVHKLNCREVSIALDLLYEDRHTVLGRPSPTITATIPGPPLPSKELATATAENLATHAGGREIAFHELGPISFNP